ncbi:MAG: discoidin domain-containing protein [Tannerella sp.]|jgi:hypothetical protein|nr:discoidin domain-containing protein [Tannerella sp.]
MKHLIFLFITLSLSSTAQTGTQRRLIDSDNYETEELGVADYTDASHESIDKTGVNDSRNGIQELLTRLGNAGGGTLYLTAGRYRIDGKIIIPHGVILRGDWNKPQPSVSGTILMAYHGRGSEDEAESFITMEPSTGLYNIALWYPEQKPDNITPYPPAILYGRQGYWGNDYCNVRNVTLVNAYSGVILSQRNGGGCPNVFNLYGTPLKRGIELDNIADVGRLDWIYFSPDYWAESSLPDAPTKGDNYADFIRNNATAIVMRRNDWSYTCNTFIDGYKIGFHAAPSIASAGSQPNGHNYGMTFNNCSTAILIESVSNAGMMFTRIKIDNCTQGISVIDGAASTVQLYDCNISASDEAIRMSSGASTRLLSQQCRIDAGKVNIMGGVFTSVDGDFNSQLNIGAYARTILSGNRFATTANIRNNSLFECKIDHTPVSIKKLPTFPNIIPHETKPARKALYVVTDDVFGAKPDAVTDNTAAIQNALNKASEDGGGVVFMPSGKYKVTGNLTIPTGVELKGASDVASVPKGQGAIIEVYADKNNPTGQPFMKLSARSGIRGLTFNYPETKSSMTINPATLPKYPYCIQATGNDIYIVNIGIRATYYGIDLFTHKCDNHYVDYLAGHVFKNAIRVGGGSKDGIISNFQFNPVVYANGYEHPKFGAWPNSENTAEAKNGVYNQNYGELEFLILEDCEDEILYNNFHYASHKGVTFRRSTTNGLAPSGIALGHGIDASMRSVCFDALHYSKGFDMINSQIVSVVREEVYPNAHFLETGANFAETANLFASDYWGGAVYGGNFAGSGHVNLYLANFQQFGTTRSFNITGADNINVINSISNTTNLVSSGKTALTSVMSSLSPLSSPTGYKTWLNNLTLSPLFSSGATLPRVGWIATGIGSENAALAIDGIASTRWHAGSQTLPGQWFSVNTRMPVKINTVILDASASPNDYPKEYAVYVSSDGVNWNTPIATGAQAAAVVIIPIPETTTQYIRVVQTGSGKTQYWSIHEFYLAYVDNASANEVVSDMPVIFPNPVTGGMIHISGATPSSAVIYSLDGQLVGRYFNRSNIDVSTYPKGIYIIKISAGTKIYTRKVIII